MTRGRFGRRKVVFLAFSSTLVMFSITGILGAKVLPKVSPDATYRFLALFEEVLSLVRYNYVEPVDGKKLMAGAYKGAAESIDPYGAYISPEEMKALKAEQKQPAGTIGLEVSKRFGYIVIICSQEGSPAHRAGLRSGDYVITVDDKSASDLSVAQAREAFNGPVGSKLRLSVIRRQSRSGDPEDLELVRAEPVRSEVVATRRGTVVHLRVRELDAAAIARVRAEAERSAGAPLLLDLRNCTTDSIDEAVALADLFLDEGDIVKIKDRRKGESTLAAGKTPAALAGPLFVLVNRGSAGAAEIVASALKHAHRAKILGEKTFGRASVQEVLPLSNGGGLRVSVAKYLAPDGSAIQGTGVEPEQKIPEPDYPPADDQDPVLDKALEAIQAGDAAAKAA